MFEKVVGQRLTARGNAMILACIEATKQGAQP